MKSQLLTLYFYIGSWELGVTKKIGGSISEVATSRPFSWCHNGIIPSHEITLIIVKLFSEYVLDLMKLNYLRHSFAFRIHCKITLKDKDNPFQKVSSFLEWIQQILLSAWSPGKILLVMSRQYQCKYVLLKFSVSPTNPTIPL